MIIASESRCTKKINSLSPETEFNLFPRVSSTQGSIVSMVNATRRVREKYLRDGFVQQIEIAKYLTCSTMCLR